MNSKQHNSGTERDDFVEITDLFGVHQRQAVPSISAVPRLIPTVKADAAAEFCMLGKWRHLALLK